MDIHQIKEIMNQNVDRICHYLLPNGKRKGKDWCVGDTNGEKGESLKVCVSGQHKGSWTDYSSGETGDLIGLWKVNRGLDLVGAVKEIKDFLNIHEPAIQRIAKKPVYSKPLLSITNKNPKVVSYLTGERKLSLQALKTYEVQSDGDFYLLPYKRDGELIHWKRISIYRNEKGKKQISSSTNTEPCLFGWQAIHPDLDEIFITEGELDAISLYQMGAPALSVPYGAGVGDKLKWIDTEWENLERFKAIYLCFDNDSEGQACVHEIATRLGLHRCHIVKLPFKDANECLCNGYDGNMLSQNIQIEDLKPDKLVSINDFKEDVFKKFSGIDSEANGIPFRMVPYSNFRFRDSEVTIWTGINGHAKSMLLSQVMLDMANVGISCCIASMEMKPDQLIYRMIRQYSGMRDPAKLLIQRSFEELSERIWLYKQLGSANLPDLLATFEYARKRYGAKHFVIDSLMKCGIDEDDYNAQKRLVDRLCEFASDMQCHVHLVCHPRKSQSEYDEPGKMAVNGAGAITNLVDNVVSVWKDVKKKEEISKPEYDDKWDSKPDGALNICKQRNGEWEGRVPLWYDVESFQFKRQQSDPIKEYMPFSAAPQNDRNYGLDD